MSSMPNVTISLNPSAQSSSRTGGNTRDQEASSKEPRENSFSKLVTQPHNNDVTESGNGLPKEEGVSESQPATSPDTISVNRDDLIVRREGRLKLVTGESPISEESLVAFMHDQGFSRAEMAEALMARQQAGGTLSGEQPLLTGDWLKTQALGVTESNVLNSEVATGAFTLEKPLNLAEALAAQLMEPKMAVKTSPIVDVIASRDMLSSIIGVADDTPGETQSGTNAKTFDLGAILNRIESGQSGLGEQATGQESGSGFERGDRMLNEPQAASQKPQEFREFLAEHLRRADSLRELSDRLGTMLARQMNAHIGRGTWRLEMALHPAELGSIEVEMEMTERGLEATFRATQSVTRDLLMDSMARLKSWFEEGGIDVAYAGLTEDSGADTGENSTSDESSDQDLSSDNIDVSDTESSVDAVIDPHRLDIRV